MPNRDIIELRFDVKDFYKSWRDYKNERYGKCLICTSNLADEYIEKHVRSHSKNELSQYLKRRILD